MPDTHPMTWSAARAVASVLVACAVVACGAERPAVTAPPVLAGSAPWPSLRWQEGGSEPDDQRRGQEVAGVAHGRAGFVSVAFDTDGPPTAGVIRWSADGLAWRRVGPDAMLADVDLVDVAATDERYVAVGTKGGEPDLGRPSEVVVLTSEDGRAWGVAPPLPGLATGYAGSIVAGPMGFVLLGHDTSGSPAAWSSPNGLDWTWIEDGDAGPPSAVAADPHRGGWIGLAANVARPVALHSADGVSWTAAPIDDSDDRRAHDVTPGPGGYLVVGDEGTCGPFSSCGGRSVGWWSGDGVGWGRLPEDSPIGAGGVVLASHPERGYLAMGSSGTWTSPDGWTWTPAEGPVGQQVDDVLIAGDTIVAVGTSYRQDGSNDAWIVVGTPD